MTPREAFLMTILPDLTTENVVIFLTILHRYLQEDINQGVSIPLIFGKPAPAETETYDLWRLLRAPQFLALVIQLKPITVDQISPSWQCWSKILTLVRPYLYPPERIPV